MRNYLLWNSWLLSQSDLICTLCTVTCVLFLCRFILTELFEKWQGGTLEHRACAVCRYYIIILVWPTTVLYKNIQLVKEFSWKATSPPHLSPPQRVSPFWSHTFTWCADTCRQVCNPVLMLTLPNAFKWAGNPRSCPFPQGPDLLHGPIRVHNPNSISIGSSVFVGLAVYSNRQKHRACDSA